MVLSRSVPGDMQVSEDAHSLLQELGFKLLAVLLVHVVGNDRAGEDDMVILAEPEVHLPVGHPREHRSRLSPTKTPSRPILRPRSAMLTILAMWELNVETTTALPSDSVPSMTSRSMALATSSLGVL